MDYTQNLPHFSNIKIDQIETDLSHILQENNQQIEKILNQTSHFNWDNLIHRLENINDSLHNYWSPINHLHSVLNSEPLRKVYHACIPKLSDYDTKLHHNEKLFQAIASIANSNEFSKLDFAQKKLIEHSVRDFKLSGIDLPPDKKEQFAKLSKELAELTTKFEDNVLDATQGWTKHILDESELSGIPAHAVQAAKQTAEKQKKEGFIFNLEAPSYIAVMKYADSAKFREEMYFAYTTRASDQGPNAGRWDNSQIMVEILNRRLELAKLLGFKNYAAYSLATKMVKEPQQVLDFLQELATASLARAKQEFKELSHFASEKYHAETLNPWDIAYYTEKLQQHRYAISQEDLRPYFPEPRVLEGLFNIVNRLFGLKIEELKNVDRWHPDVHCFAVFDQNGQIRSQFYLDLYARENKRGGAWMDDCRSHRLLDNGKSQIPIAFITCNFNAPVGDNPALFTHDDVVTLFHEFGHSLQHMLTQINYAGVSGINGVPWDAVEIASQFLENWTWEKESISFISGHYHSNEPLPDNLFNKMITAKNFQSAMQMVRQLEFALFDFKLHMQSDSFQVAQIQNTLDEVRSQVSVIPVPKFNRFQHAFSHIFAGGYAAGYYSYKWAEVMAADAFSLFKQNGIFDQATSNKFLTTFLESGGAKEPMELFIEFRGREPKIDALLEQSGIRGP